MPPASRLQAAHALLGRLNVHCVFPLSRLQEPGSPLRWGAWLGGRHAAASDAYKLYAEAPAVLSAPAVGELRDALGRYGGLLDSHALSLRLVGFDLASQRLECYFRARSLRWDQLCGLMNFTGVAHREDELRVLLDAAAGTSVRERLPDTRHGFSLSLARGGTVDAFSLFTFARLLFGSTAMIRRGLLACADRHGWNLEGYAAVSAPLAARDEADVHHGLVSWRRAARRVARVEPSASVRHSWTPRRDEPSHLRRRVPAARRRRDRRRAS